MNEVQEFIMAAVEGQSVIQEINISSLAREREKLMNRKFSVLEILYETIQYFSTHINYAEELIKAGTGPILSATFDSLTANDLSNFDKLYRADSNVENNNKSEVKDSFKGLSNHRKKLLKKLDSLLNEILQEDFSSTFTDTKTTIKQEENSNATRKRRFDAIDSPGASVEKKRGVMTSDDSTAKPTAVPVTTSSQSSSTAVIPTSNVAVSSTKKKSTYSFTAAEVFVAILTELQKFGIDTTSLESSIYQFEVNSSMLTDSASAASLLLLVWSLLQNEKQIVDEEAQEKRIRSHLQLQELPDLAIHNVRTAAMVAADYLKSIQDSMKAFDQAFQVAKKESSERFRKRWELLCNSKATTIALGKKFAMTDVPIFMDRIPNPFGSTGADYPHWKWLIDGNTPSADTSSGEDSELEELSRKNKLFVPISRYHVRAKQLRDTLFGINLSASSSLVKYFRQSIFRCLFLLASCLPAIVIDKYSSEGNKAGVKQEGDDNDTIEDLGVDDQIMHRALLIGTLVTTYCGSARTEIDPKIAAEMKRFRKIAGTEVVDNWGPVLIVTRMTDLEAWEIGLSTLLKDFQLEILAYYGSDADRLALRSYLRAMNIAGGMHPLGSGLYHERSHCHVILISYEALLLDLHYFKEILWWMIIYDQPWGFFSNEQYSTVFPALLEFLRSRQRIFTADSISSFTIHTGIDSDDKEGNRFQKGQLPDLHTLLPFLCPSFVGIPTLEEMLRSQTIGSNTMASMISSVGGITAFLKKFVQEQKNVLFLNNGIDTIDIDYEKSDFYLTNFVAVLTIVYDPTLFEALEGARQTNTNSTTTTSAADETNSTTTTTPSSPIFPINEMLTLSGILVWIGAELQVATTADQLVLPQSNQISYRYYQITKDNPSLSTLFQSGFQQLGADLWIIHPLACFATNRYQDMILTDELKNVNLLSVGKTGLNVQRYIIDPPVPIDPMPFETMTTSLLAMNQQLSAMTGNNQNDVMMTSNGASLLLPSMLMMQQQQLQGGNNPNPHELMASMAMLAGMVPEQIQPMREQMMMIGGNPMAIAPIGGGRGAGGPGGRGGRGSRGGGRGGRTPGTGRGRGRGRGGRGRGGSSAPVAPVVYDPDEEIPAPVVDQTTSQTGGRGGGRGSRGGGARGRGRGGRKPWKNIPPEGSVNRTIGGEELEDNHDDDDDEEGKDRKSSAGISNNRPLTVEEEMTRYISKKGNVWSASIIVSARQRFLGYFRDEESAKQAFTAAFHQREEAFHPSGDSTAVILPASKGMMMSKFKGKISKDVKLSDGSFIADEFYRSFDSDGLVQDIYSLLLPQHLAKVYLSDWITTYNQPPAYAMLRHRNGTEIFIPSLTCILGSMQSDVVTMFEQLGMPEHCAMGFIYDYTATIPPMISDGMTTTTTTTTSEEYPPIFQKMFHPSATVCCMHLASDPNITSQHAFLRYNPLNNKFEIRALTSQGIFMNGNLIQSSHGFIPLHSKTMLQFGNQMFIFVLPPNSSTSTMTGSSITPSRGSANHSSSVNALTAKKDNLIILRRNVLKCLIESIKLRDPFITSSSDPNNNIINTDLKISKLESLEMALLSGVSMMKESSTSNPATSSAGGADSTTGNEKKPSPAGASGKKGRKKASEGEGEAEGERTQRGKEEEEAVAMEVEEREEEQDDVEGEGEEERRGEENEEQEREDNEADEDRDEEDLDAAKTLTDLVRSGSPNSSK